MSTTWYLYKNTESLDESTNDETRVFRVCFGAQ